MLLSFLETAACLNEGLDIREALSPIKEIVLEYLEIFFRQFGMNVVRRSPSVMLISSYPAYKMTAVK